MKNTLPDLTGVRSIVTGAARGIGRGIATVLQEAGARVLWVDLEAQKLRLRQAPIKKDSFWTLADISVPDDCDRLVGEALKCFGGVDLLVNNAATWNDCSLWEGTPAVWTRVFQVNVVGTLYLSRRVAGEMIIDGTAGSIIFITSIHERVPRRWDFDYAASKAAQRLLVKELALEFAPFDIRVNNLAPGDIENRPAQVARGKRAKNSYVPLGGFSGLPEDMGRTLTALVSPYLSGYITGASITVDAGLSLHNHWVDQLPLKKTARKERVSFLRRLKWRRKT